MIIKDIIDEDLLNYKKPSMFIIFPRCDFKCDRENGCAICQNSSVAKMVDVEYCSQKIVDRYTSNPITKAIVCGGLEPFDTFGDLLDLVKTLRMKNDDDIVIYTGYKPNEIETQINILKSYPNIIIKYGRFIPNQKQHYDDILGINLASVNQYALKIS